ncbi:alkaline phosphatase family protein [Pantoea sp. BAV 3049]|uniref:alkaline phosphatase family protein n=1 Tax=Pantoea sp. BAV 3049 TaxID=2654188 RepID=UPI00131D6BBA|nr:alkaline phosphatase family protein [Pantoea sp. BAV 3049]
MRKVIVFGVDGLTMPLLKRYSDEGILPHIRTLFQQGAACELLPFISAWGDVNWVTFMAGQCPGTSWIGQGSPTDNAATGNLLSLMKNKGLRASLVHFPETVAADSPHFSFAPYWGRAAAWPAEQFKAMGHTTLYEQRTGNKQARQQKLGWPPSSSLAYHEKGAWQPLEQHEGTTRLTMQAQQGLSLAFTLDESASQPVLRLADEHVTLTLGQWSDWLPLSNHGVEGSVRFFLGRYQPALNEIEILQSQVTRKDRLTSDQALGNELLKNFGPFYSKWVVKASPQESYLSATLQEGDEQSLWLCDTAISLTQKHDFSLWATVHRLADESHHNCLGQVDPQSPFYEADKAQAYDDVMRECYKVLDKSIGKLLQEMDDETTLMLASDHGAVPNEYMCDINRYLQKHGLVTLTDRGDPIVEQSKVYLKDDRGGLEIFANLQGRETHGCVSAEEYDAVRAEVLLALGSWKVQHHGKPRNAVSLALLKEDAVGIGFWGSCAGDIVFAYNAGFVWGTSRTGEDICPVEVPGANHGPQKPTAETSIASNYGVLLAYGAGIRQGYYRDRQQKGPYRMVDPAATIAHLLGLEHASLDGTVMHDLLSPNA